MEAKKDSTDIQLHAAAILIEHANEVKNVTKVHREASQIIYDLQLNKSKNEVVTVPRLNRTHKNLLPKIQSATNIRSFNKTESEYHKITRVPRPLLTTKNILSSLPSFETPHKTTTIKKVEYIQKPELITMPPIKKVLIQQPKVKIITESKAYTKTVPSENFITAVPDIKNIIMPQVQEDELQQPPNSIFQELTTQDVLDEINHEIHHKEEKVQLTEETVYVLPNLLAKDNLQELLTGPVYEPEAFTSTAQEFINFIDLLPSTTSEDQTPITTEDLIFIDVLPLPAICTEVSAIISELAVEPAEIARALFYEISELIDKVDVLLLNSDETAPLAQAELERVCSSLLVFIGKKPSPENITVFLEGIRQTKHKAQIIQDKKAPRTKRGTREIKDEHDQIFGGMVQDIEDDLARAIGTHAVRNYQFALA